MELDDLKANWQQIHSAEEKTMINQKTFTVMSKRKMQAALKSIVIPEIIGSIVCLAAAVYVGVHFNRLNSITFQVTGLLTIILLLALPVLSLLSLFHLHKSSDLQQSYAGALQEFSIRKIKFCKLQKLNLLLSHVLLVLMILLTTKLFGSHRLTENKSFWIIAICSGYIILTFFSKWVARSYSQTIRHTENLLRELSEEIR